MTSGSLDTANLRNNIRAFLKEITMLSFLFIIFFPLPSLSQIDIFLLKPS